MRRPNVVKIETPALPFTNCLAKTVTKPDGTKGPGLDVEKHCLNVGLVARELISRLPETLQKTLYPAGSELVAAVHDVGKVSPDFQKKILMSYTSEKDLPEAVINGNPNREELYGYHGGISQAAIEAIPTARSDIAKIIGKHHGRSISHIYSAEADIFGGATWQREREALVEKLKKDLDIDWPPVNGMYHALVISGLTTVADWIGSGNRFAELSQGANEDWRFLARESVDAAGFQFPKINLGMSFFDIFGFHARPAQQALIDSINGPGLYVLEAPMGSGKTEAALYASYRMLEQKKATGLYFAMPTRLTSNRIYHRVNDFLKKILDNPRNKAKLCHGAAWLLESDLGEEGLPGKSWFDQSKRSLLAPFGVGTIDQALLAIMNVKHGFVRAFGLAGKVVILDEVHSYDSYTGTILDELAALLKEIECTAIILSATLSRQRKELLLHTRFAQPRNSYPLVSINTVRGKTEEIEIEQGGNKLISLKRVSNDQCGLEEALSRAQHGQQVLWIENTVGDAQNIFKNFASRGMPLGLEIGLLHSRYLAMDREKNEKYWVELYGGKAIAERNKTGRILVGTQVLEQSLDLDADFLVTRLAPTDMLLQRIGRLWRHNENDMLRPGAACQEAWILTPSIFTAIKQGLAQTFGKSVFVYAPYVLLRTLELLETMDNISLPRDIREFIENTYCERQEAGIWEKTRSELEKEKEKLQRFAVLGTATAMQTQNDTNPSTRFGDEESCQLLLMKSSHIQREGIAVRFLDGTESFFPSATASLSRNELKKMAVKLLENIVTVPKRQAPRPNSRLGELFGGYVYFGRGEEDDFRLGCVTVGGEITDSGGNTASTAYELYYDSRLGYSAKRIRKGNN